MFDIAYFGQGRKTSIVKRVLHVIRVYENIIPYKRFHMHEKIVA